MKPFSLVLPVILFLLLLFGPNTHASRLDHDHLALLKFKESISKDPFGILNSWNSSTHFCNWHGIKCSYPKHQRVRELNLKGYQLNGIISPFLGNLSFLIDLNLANNSFHGKIPQELGRLLQLQLLSLTNNSLAGEIPINLTNCNDLKELHLFGNNLIGKIPTQFVSLKKLQTLSIAQNNLTGRLPPFIGNLSSLIILSLGMNNLEGHIPHEICHLKNLTLILIHVNKLSGTFPSCFYNMSSLTIISAAENKFSGSLPPNMFHSLHNLQEFLLGGNQISGSIPTSITNATILQTLDLSQNHLVGQVSNLGKLRHLWFLSLYSNNLGDNSTEDLEFLESLTNCSSKLQVVSISYNNFGGSLPNSLGNLSSQLSQLYLGGNQISGEIPAELGNLVSLTLLTLEINHLEGIIPATFGKFQNMQKLELSRNKLSGHIPTNIGNLSQLYYLGMGENLLEGNIPLSIGNCQKLQYLDLWKNKLRGTIPLEIFGLSSLTNLLDLSQNLFSGNLPNEVGGLKNIEKMDVSGNHLSGDIPEAIGECISLEYLFLQGNSFHGAIPSSLASLKGLRVFDVAQNHLSGSIPKGLQNISFLEYFNISFNMLEGEVPIEGVFGNASELSVTGNVKLCGGISQLHLPPCPIKGKKVAKHENSTLIAIIVVVVVVTITLSITLTIYCMRKRNKMSSSDSSTINQLAKVSYQNLHLGTDGFSSRNLIGFGSFGSVYKGTIALEDRLVAIKVLNLGKNRAQKSFFVECNALKNIRHRNLVKILTCCSSIDYKGQEFKALVFEYMKNGSLESWLHPSTGIAANQPKSLDLGQRLNIIIDVASAFHYLHYECEQVIVHCDMKPSNVLLDDCLVAHVSDFGLSRLFPTTGVSTQQTSSIGIKGTIGYAPPEYGIGLEVSIEGDVYSFGILILEILTGKRPTDEMFNNGHNLHNYVKVSIPSNISQIVDPVLLLTKEIEQESGSEHLITFVASNVEKCLLSLLRIGLACSVESPKERLTMIDVIRELQLIKSLFHLEK